MLYAKVRGWNFSASSVPLSLKLTLPREGRTFTWKVYTVSLPLPPEGGVTVRVMVLSPRCMLSP